MVVFETIFPIWADQVQSRGGGVAFFPIETSDWSSVVTAIVHEHFHHRIIRSAEVGISTLDEAVLEQFCHRYAGAFWQGGDTL